MSVRRLTPPGAGAVAVLEVTGEEARSRLAAMLGRPLPAAGTVTLGRLVADGETLDEVLVVGRDLGAVEVHLHGSPAVVRAAFAHLGGEARAAALAPAERARRAAHRAPSRAGARVLLEQAAGAFDRGIARLAASHGAERAELAAELLERGRLLQPLLQPTVVAITGPVNAGKSTLFNALLGKDEALVSDVEGTTRDVIAGACELEGRPLVVLDTAGLREIPTEEGQAAIEAEGMRLGARAAGRADLVLALGAGADTPPPGPPQVRLVARADERFGPDPSAWPEGAISACLVPEHARRIVAASARAALGWSGSGAEVAAGLVGLPTPFEPWMLAALEGALADGAADARLETLPAELARSAPVLDAKASGR